MTLVPSIEKDGCGFGFGNPGEGALGAGATLNGLESLSEFRVATSGAGFGVREKADAKGEGANSLVDRKSKSLLITVSFTHFTEGDLDDLVPLLLDEGFSALLFDLNEETGEPGGTDSGFLPDELKSVLVKERGTRPLSGIAVGATEGVDLLAAVVFPADIRSK